MRYSKTTAGAVVKPETDLLPALPAGLVFVG